MAEAAPQSLFRSNRTDLSALLNNLDVKLEDNVRLNEMPKEIDQIGEGAYGTVYCYQLPDKNLIAGKKLKINLFSRSKDQDNQLKKCLRNAVKEVNILKLLNHERIIRYVGCYWDAQQFVLFTELMQGGSVKDLLRDSNLPEIRALRYFIQTAQGLSFLHSRKPNPIVHRDVKCENLLLDSNDNVKLADFGVALTIALNDGVTLTAQQTTGWPTFAGTLLFAAPEVRANFIGNKVTYGRKADVWSLACTIVEMLTGEPPHFEIFSKLGMYEFMKRSTDVNDVPYSGHFVPHSCSLTHGLLNFMFVINIHDRPSINQTQQYLREALNQSPNSELTTLTDILPAIESRWHAR